MFDLNTLRLISMVGFVGFVFTALMLWHLVPQERSMKYWALSALLIAVGMLLLGLRGLVPGFISIVIANTVIMLGAGFMYVGTHTLFSKGVRYAWQWVAAAFTFLICMVTQDISVRVAITSIFYALFFLECARLFWSKGEDTLRLTKRMTACVFALGAILFVYRALNPPVQVLPALYVSGSSLLEAAPYLYALLLSMWTPLTLMLIVSTRLQFERSDAVVRARETFHELEESEFRWKFAIEGSGDGLWDWDVPAGKVFYSKRWKELLGFSVEDISDGLHEWEQRIHPDDKAGTMLAVKNHFDGKTPNYSYEHRLLCKDGSYKWILTRGLVVTRDASGKPIRVIGTHTDISEAKLQESYIKYRNQVLEMLANGEPMEQVLLAIVDGLELIHPDMLCSILLLGDDGKHLTGGVAPRLPDFYNQAIEGIEIGVGQGSCGTAAFTGERVIVTDIFSHPYWAAFRDIAARAGLASCWSQPIKSSSHKILGTFAIYHREPHQPTQADIVLIEQSADLVSIALDKNAAEVQLRDREKQLQLVLEASQLGFWDWNISKQTVIRNERWAEMLGYSLNDIEFNVKQWLDFIHPDDQAAAWKSIQDCLDGVTAMHSIEYRMRTKDGQYKWILDQAQVVERDASQKAVRMCGTHTDITERKLMENQMRHQALYDGLTQLPNRYLLEDRLGQAMAKSKRTGYYGALMFLDLDNFKPLNDTHGHAVGDLLLIEVADRLRGCVREADTVARVGGDEFVVKIDQLDADWAISKKEALATAEKIRLSLAEPYILQVTDEHGAEATVEHRCTASIGVILFIGNQISQQDIMRWADDAMYQAKDAGRNQIHFYETNRIDQQSGQ